MKFVVDKPVDSVDAPMVLQDVDDEFARGGRRFAGSIPTACKASLSFMSGYDAGSFLIGRGPARFLWMRVTLHRAGHPGLELTAAVKT